ncbi:hypothetical protein RDWZM_001365 [Blomia tropicalis]|uniref:Protein kinase domain-containing protein n=1 Tax=Blomia tropicalis TaxID=40697 RepID=A0A9Q0RQN4_BLOTA|nr:hypothetical protein BLOT_007405 [Blomia tropicalis]KAJ6222820.1 hypothetical protein RDWZM_001365 [Blomia tropicalis]
MCQCFGRKKDPNQQTLLNHNKQQTEITLSRRHSPNKSKKTRKTITPTTSPKLVDSEEISASKSSAKLLSSPSAMKTTDLTEIFNLPDKDSIDKIVQSNGFVLEDKLGSGTYAIVYRARRQADNLMLACKIMELMNKSRKANLSAKNELFILERINHPHIVKLYKHFMVDVEQCRYVYIFMQLAEGKSLSVFMRKLKSSLPEDECKRLFAQIASGVGHVHEKGIAHRDLKMGNILMDRNNNALIADFGLSRVTYRPSKGGTQMSNKFCGTVPYMAPEILLAKKYTVEYDPFVADVWALGVILYCIVNRGYPFVNNDNLLDQQIEYKVKYSNRISFNPEPQLTDLLTRLLNPNVVNRITTKKLLVHPWIINQVNEINRNIRKANELRESSTSEQSHTRSICNQSTSRKHTSYSSSMSSK